MLELKVVGLILHLRIGLLIAVSKLLHLLFSHSFYFPSLASTVDAFGTSMTETGKLAKKMFLNERLLQGLGLLSTHDLGTNCQPLWHPQ